MRKVEVVGAVLIFLWAGAACLPREVRTPVQYLGHDDGVVAPRKVPTKKVFIEVDNQRGNSTLLGEDTSNHVPIHADPEAITRITLRGFRTEFAHIGIPLAKSRAEADRVVRVILTSVKVEEGFSYSANLLAVIEVSSGAGAPIGRTQADGMGMRFGGDDYSGQEVNAVLNNALAKLISNVLADAEFLRMLGD